MLAQDETLEIGNQFFAAFPMVRQLKSFVRQGSYVGMCQMCKQIFRMFYTMSKKNSKKIYRGSTECDMSPEQRLIYEIISILLGYFVTQSFRAFNKKSINVGKLRKSVKLKSREPNLRIT